MSLTYLIIAALCLFGVWKLAKLMYGHYVFRQQFKGIPAYPAGFLSIGLPIDGLAIPREELISFGLSICSRFKEGFFLAWFAHVPYLLMYQPEHLEVILSHTKNIKKSIIYEPLQDWFGEGLLTSSGSRWFHDRKLLTPTFHFDILQAFAPIVFKKTIIFIERLDKELSKNPKKPINIVKPISNYTLDVICETAMGIDLRVQSDIEQEYTKNIRTYSSIVIDRIINPILGWKYIYAISPQGFVGRAALKAMHKFTENVIRERRLARIAEQNTKKCGDQAEEEIGKRKRKAFLDLLLDMSDSQDHMLTDKDIREQVDTFMFEGHDTTASALTFALFCLGANPDIQEKVHDEIEEVFGDHKGEATMNQIHQLEYLGRAIKESMRLYTTVPAIGRELQEEVNIAGYNIPKGTQIGIAPWATHRDPNHWPDPMKFDPDRFLPDNIKNRHPYAYIPFSAGPRNCIGQKLAQMEEKILLTEVLRKWRVKSVETPENLIVYPNLVSHPVKGVHIYFTPKH